MPDDSDERSEAEDIMQVVQRALLLRPPTVSEEPTILSIDPTVWAGQGRVIDIARLLHVTPTVPGMEAELERRVSMSFQSAGWPVERIVREYRPDLKSRIIIDVALLGDDGQCLVALEVKRNAGVHWSRRLREAWVQLQTMAPGVPWHCVTDGITFNLRSTASGRDIPLLHAFSPESLSTGNFDSPGSSGCAPGSFEDLRELLKSTRWVILDYTIPAMRLDQANPTRAALEEAHGRTLPGPIDVTQALLAWLGELDGITWLSAFALASLLRGESSQWVREKVGNHLWVRGVIEVGGVLPGMSAAVRFCLIHLGSTPGQAFLAAIGGRGDSRQELSENVAAASQFFVGQPPATGFVAEVARTGRWAVGLYDPELDKLEKGLAGIGPTKQLSELCKILRGVRAVRQLGATAEGIPVVTRMAHLEALEHDDLGKISRTPQVETFVLRPGDLVVPAIKGGAHQCVMIQSEEPLVASEHLFILRVTDANVSPEYLVEYLNSTIARRLIESRYSGVGVLTLTPRSLGSLPVPVVERPVALDLRQIGSLEAALRQNADELSMQRRSLFDTTSAEGFYAAVQDLRRRGELLSSSVLRANELEFQVANFFPFPIAYGYRLLASITNPTELYKEQLRIGENILAFLASVAMSLIQPSDRASVELDVRKVWDGGASPGHWHDIVGRCCKVLGTYKDHPLAASIVGLKITAEKRGFGAAIKKLITTKNNFKHDRGPRTEEEFATATKEMQQTLETCIKALAFFTEHPIRQVVDYDVTRTGEIRLRCLALVGDHPGLPQEEITYRTPLPKRDLYIAAAGVGWVSLFPLLVARNCPSCKTRETFFLDKWDRSTETAMRKSFERGHEEQTKEVVQNMASWIAAAPK